MFQLPPGEERDETSVEVSALPSRQLSTIVEDVPLYIISPATSSTGETKSTEIVISLTNHAAGNEEKAVAMLAATTTRRMV